MVRTFILIQLIIESGNPIYFFSGLAANFETEIQLSSFSSIVDISKEYVVSLSK